MHLEIRPAQADHTTFPFLELPGELRNKIYKILLRNTSRVPSGAYRSSSSLTKLSICGTILRVSKQVHHEAAPYLYTLNRFNAHPQLLKGLPFLADPSRPVISALYSSMITRFYIAVRLDNDPRWSADDLRKAFSGVQELEVEAWQSSYGITDTANLIAFAAIRAVGRARVHGCGVSSEFSEWLETVMQSPADTTAHDWHLADWNPWANGNR